MYRNDTLCISCKNSVLGCSWSKTFTPVEGWIAESVRNKSGYDTFIVKNCPQYEYDGLCLRCKYFDENFDNSMKYYKVCKMYKGSQGYGDCAGYKNKYKTV